ncbi:Protein of unknown function [Bradyrhizobium erythrophlei]|nr:Protein of unknown function [Bradyrhizobium erythrophlei]
MNRAVAVVSENGWQVHASKISAAWQKGTDSIIEVGRLLIEAKKDPKLQHGSFEVMVRTRLPFNEQTAQKLMKIANNPVISKAAHVRLLPPSWGTLYELTKVPEPRLIAAIEDGTINPKTQRKDVKPLLDVKPKATREAVVAATPPELTLLDNPHLVEIGDCVNGLRDQLRGTVSKFNAEERAELFLRLKHLIEQWEKIGNEH